MEREILFYGGGVRTISRRAFFVLRFVIQIAETRA